MILNIIFGFLALLSFALLLWQWLVARRFPLHQRMPAHSFPPAVTFLKPLKGCEPSTEDCLRSWFVQEYTGRVQLLFGVDSADDPVGSVVRKLQQEFPASDSQLIVCGPPRGANAKVSKLVELDHLAKHDLLVISDADVRVPVDFLANVIDPLREDKTSDAAQAPAAKSNGAVQSPCGLVNCFYCLANPTTLAMQWEAIAINADFWTQVLQAQSLKPLDFALGAVMVTTRQSLQKAGGFAALVNCLADDYQLGNRIARGGESIVLSTVPVECFSAAMGWRAVWKHQMRWARTIRVSQPAPYFFSILSNAMLWPLLWLAMRPGLAPAIFGGAALVMRVVMAVTAQTRLSQRRTHLRYWWLTPVKDLLQVAIWAGAFLGNTIEWRGQRMKLRRDGEVKIEAGDGKRDA